MLIKIYRTFSTDLIVKYNISETGNIYQNKAMAVYLFLIFWHLISKTYKRHDCLKAKFQICIRYFLFLYFNQKT